MNKKKANARRRWKMERASVKSKRTGKVRSNKYSKSDNTKKPKAHSRKGLWVGGYTKKDGTKVSGYYRTNSQYRWRK